MDALIGLANALFDEKIYIREFGSWRIKLWGLAKIEKQKFEENKIKMKK